MVSCKRGRDWQSDASKHPPLAGCDLRGTGQRQLSRTMPNARISNRLPLHEQRTRRIPAASLAKRARLEARHIAEVREHLLRPSGVRGSSHR